MAFTTRDQKSREFVTKPQQLALSGSRNLQLNPSSIHCFGRCFSLVRRMKPRNKSLCNTKEGEKKNIKTYIKKKYRHNLKRVLKA